ncbi:hypothetical protein BGX21_001420 [Mortierella sp. AD011]|nr:hypothetical protein BGX21_001420 [Mortierella sp. AD011]
MESYLLVDPAPPAFPAPPAYSVDPPDKVANNGMEYIQKGDRCRDIGDFKGAAKCYEQAIRDYPELAQERLKRLPLDVGLFGELSASWDARTLRVKKYIAELSNKSPHEFTLTGPYFPKRALSLQEALEFERSPVSQIFDNTNCAVGEPLTTISLVTSYVKAESTSKIELHNQIKPVIMQFEKNFISLDTVQELVILATIPDKEIFIGIANQMLKVLRDSPILSCEVLQGLAVILNACPEQIDLSNDHGAFQDILKPITDRLNVVRQDKNGNQLIPLLRAISALFDAMICRKVVGVDRDNIYLPLRNLLRGFSKHSDPTVSYLAQYASQGLEFIGDDEPMQMTIFRYGKLAFALANDVKDITLNMDINSFASAYDNLTQLCDFPKKYVWYQGLIYLNCAMGLKDWSQFESFVINSKLKSDDKFLQGVCLYLERIVATQVNEDVRNGATRFLYALMSKSSRPVQKVAQSALQRLGIKTETGTFRNGFLKLFASRSATCITPQVSQEDIPPIWDPLWYSNPSNVLLRIVQAKMQRDKNISALLKQVEALQLDVKASNADLKADMDVKLGEILSGVASIKDSNTTTASTLEEVHAALYNYYQGDLFVRRVSGDKKSLDSCFINLAVVAAQDQKQKDKEELKATVMASIQERKKTDPLASIPIEELFDKRKLRDGRVDEPKKILIHGRAGVGKTTLCKKLIHLYQQGALWRDRFDAVLWLPLRQLRTLKLRNLEDLLHQSYFSSHLSKEKEKLTLSVINLIRDGKVLFALDGLDEFVKDAQSQEGLIMEEFLKNLLRQEYVVITTRPSGVDNSILPKLDLELEAVGFSSKNVEDYISMAFESDAKTAESVRDFIQRTSLVQDLVKIPVQLDALCYSWEDLPSDGESITMTKLYRAMIGKLCSNDVIRLGKVPGLSHGQIAKAGSRKIREMLESEIECLEYMAFRGMRNDHQIEFDESTIRRTVDDLDGYREETGLEALPFELFENLKQMSFLHTSDASLDSGKDDSRRSWYFLHLTFQEYFAAAWLVRHLQTKRTNPTKPSVVSMTPRQTTEFVQRYKYDPRYEIVWRMVAGLLEGSALESFFDLLQRPPRDLIGARHRLLLAGCYMESRPSLSSDSIKWIEKELLQWLEFKMKLKGQSVDERNWRGVITDEVSTRSSEKDIDEQVRPTKTSGWFKRIASASHSPVGAIASVACGATVISVETSCGPIEYDVSKPDLRSGTAEECISYLIMELQNEDLRVRISAAERLCSLHRLPELPESDITVLISALQDDSSDLRRLVAKALGGQSCLPEHAITALVDLLKDEVSDVRVSAVKSLGRQSSLPEHAIAALASSLKDDNSEVRRSTVKALGQNSPLPEYAITGLIGSFQDEDEEVRSLAAEVIGSQSTLSESAIMALVATLQSQYPGSRRSTVKILGQQPSLQEYVIAAVIGSFQDEDEEVRRLAADVIGNQSELSESSVTALVAALQGRYPDSRRSAVKILGQQPSLQEYVIMAIIGSFQDEDEEVRGSAAEVIGNQSELSESAITALVAALQGRYPDSRRSTVKILGQQPSLQEYVIMAIIGSFQDEDEKVRSLAAEVIAAQSTLSESAITALVAALQGRYPDSRRSTVKILGQQPSLQEFVIIALIGSFQDEDEEVRRLAAEVIGSQSTLSESAVTALVATLQSQYPDSRRYTVKILGRQPSLQEYVVTALIDSFRDEDSEVRRLAAEVIGKQSIISESAIVALVAILQSEYSDSRRFVVGILVQQSPLQEYAILSLTSSLQDKRADVRRSVIQVLQCQPTLSESTIVALASSSKDEDYQVRESVVDVFSRQSLLPVPAVAALEVALQDEIQYIRELSAYALGRQPTLPDSAVAALVTNIQDKNWYVRRAAGNALGAPRICLAVPKLSTDEISQLYMRFLFEYCCTHPVSLFIHDDRLQFYTERGFGQSDILSPEVIKGIVSAFVAVQHAFGVDFDPMMVYGVKLPKYDTVYSDSGEIDSLHITEILNDKSE